MKHRFSLLLIAVMLAITSPAFATKKPTPTPPVKPDPVVPTPSQPSVDVDVGATNTNLAGAAALSGSQSGAISANENTNLSQAVTGPSSSDASATGGDSRSASSSESGVVGSGNSSATGGRVDIGDTSATGGAGGKSRSTSGASSGSESAANSGGNSIDASSRYDNRTVFIPPVNVPVPPSIVPAGNIIVHSTPCGPRHEVTHAPLNGTFHGLFRTKKVDLGVTDYLQPSRTPFIERPGPNGSTQLIGTQITIFASTLSVSGARQLSLGGGGGSNMDWVQGGLGTSLANQQLALRIVALDCEYGSLVPVVGEVAGANEQHSAAAEFEPIVNN